MEFIYTVDPLASKPIMLLNDDIGVDPETGKGIDGAKFMAELMALDAMNPQCIEIWINSPGGVVLDGYNIYSAILRTNTKVDTVGVGCMASIAAVIFQAGRTRTMMDFSWLMYHNAHGGDDQKVLDTMDSSIGKMVARSGKDEAQIRQMMKRETYITAQEALDYGLCDRIESSSDHNKKRLTPQMPVTAFHKEANKILNKIIDTKTSDKMDLKLVTNKLGLNENASEHSILQAIEVIQNKAKDDKVGLEGQIANLQKCIDDASEEMDKLKKEKDTLSKSKNDLDGEVDKMKNQLTVLTKEKEDAELAGKEAEAKAEVMNYANVGRIKNEEKVIEFWTAQWMADPAIAKEQIEELPLNKIAPIVNKASEGSGVRYTAGAVMAQINAKRNKLNIN